MIRFGRLASSIVRVAGAAAKNPAATVATVTSIALALNQVVDGVDTIRSIAKKGR